MRRSIMSHPYRMPVIGWEHEMAQAVARGRASTFYKRIYTPNNAILVVAGDVTRRRGAEARRRDYGKLPANPDVTRACAPAGARRIAPRAASS